MKNLLNLKNITIYLLLTLLPALSYASGIEDGDLPSSEGSFENGKRLHDANCTRCHDSDIYTRPKRIVNSLEELKKRVTQCELSAELTWFEEDINDVVLYLDENYYKFPLE